MCVFCVAYQDTETVLYYNNQTTVIVQLCNPINYTNNLQRIIFAWYQMLMMFLLPVFIMGYCYAVVIHVLWLSTKELAKMTRCDR